LKRSPLLLFTFVVALTFILPAEAQQGQPIRGLTGVDEVARVYDAILDARFERVPAMLREACGPAPREACQLLDAVSAWWRIQLDPLSTIHDAAFESKVEAAIAATRAWTEREPLRAEAWFYLGGAYGARVQWWALRGRRLPAARDGRRIKEALERALALDPGMADAYFGLGLYQYYADVAPRALKMLRWIMLLPGGNRSAGIEQMIRARDTGRLVRSEVDYQLYVIDVWYEKQPQRALECLARLRTRHPHNPHFSQAMADIQDFYLDDTAASLRTWTMLLEAAERGQVAESRLAEANARLGIAAQLDQLSRGQAALEHLHAVIDARPTAPFGVIARAHLQLGQTLEHLGRRADATAAYRAAIATAGRNDPLEIATRARTSLRAIERSSRSTTTQ
jgi:tetratricopeptide (TPR) repeat protein